METRRFIDKVVCITGSNRGMGKQFATAFAAEGADLILCARNRTDEFELFIEKLKERNGVTVYPIYFDLSEEAAVKDGIKAIKGLKLKINVLINNAGVPHLAILPFTKMEDVRKVFQVNYFAQLQIIQSLISVIAKNADSCIINMASIAGIDGDIGNCVYGATKSAMILLTKVLSKELSNSKIRVNAIAPGLTETDFSEKMGEKAKESMKLLSCAGRLATTEEVACCALFLASHEASFINGEVIRMDGGKRN